MVFGLLATAVLCDMSAVLRLRDYAAAHPAAAAEEMLRVSSHTVMEDIGTFSGVARNASLPVVLGHGMGDSCFNAGFKSVTAAVGAKLGVYAVCIPTGDNRIEDTINGFLKNMDASVDTFAAKVRKDPKLARGFYAIGLSQGNNLIRGYIQKYNDPPVKAFISICGINAGVAAFPQCAPSIPVAGVVCEALTSLLGDLAYNGLVQSILFQANYFRDPSKLGSRAYREHSQLAQWNGEGSTPPANMTAARANWANTSKFVWVRGTLDTVVWPNLGEQWGAVSDGYPRNLTTVPMRETRWFLDDAFGLRTADEVGKNFFEEFRGQHIRFKMAELDAWLDKYFT